MLLYANNRELVDMNGNLIMYTCYGTSDTVMVTLWEKVS